MIRIPIAFLLFYSFKNCDLSKLFYLRYTHKYISDHNIQLYEDGKWKINKYFTENKQTVLSECVIWPIQAHQFISDKLKET